MCPGSLSPALRDDVGIFVDGRGLGVSWLFNIEFVLTLFVCSSGIELMLLVEGGADTSVVSTLGSLQVTAFRRSIVFGVRSASSSHAVGVLLWLESGCSH